MNIKITGKDLKATEAIKDYIERKMERLEKYYETEDLPNRPWRAHDLTTQRTADERPNSAFTLINPKN